MESGSFAPVGTQQSHALFALSRGNALVRVEPGATVRAGAAVRIFRWEE